MILGIESSAHTFGVGIVHEGKVLANQKAMYDVGSHGVIPAKAAEFQVKNASTVIAAALKSAGIRFSDLDGVGYTRGPGLGPCLHVGALSARTVAARLGIPIAPVNHGVGHIEIARHVARMKDPLVLYVSGGNSQILKIEKTPQRHYRVLGETFDIGVGNMIDTFARALKLNPAWGSTVEKLASGGSFVDLPYTVKGMDFSFTGILTRASELIGSHGAKDLCYSVQEVAYSMLCEATERAMLLTNSKELCVSGGVAQSTRLKEMLKLVAKEHGARFGYAGNEFNADNGAMIAFVAERLIGAGLTKDVEQCDIEQRYRVDSAVVPA